MVLKMKDVIIVSTIIWGTYVASGVLFGFNTGLSARDYNACIVSLSIVCSVWAALFVDVINSRFHIMLLSVLLVLSVQNVIALFALASRTSCITVVIGIAYLVVKRTGCKRLKASNVMVLFVSLFVVLGMLLYFVRPDSADGRILIWRVSISMLTDNLPAFLFGYGINGFSKYYMPAQARYFSAHPDCSFIPLAGDVFTPYNEFLHVAITFGIIGLIVVLFVLLSVFYAREHGSEDIAMKSLLISFVVFSCFSFPLSSLPLCVYVLVILVVMRKWVLSRFLNISLLLIIGCASAAFGLESYCKAEIDESIRSRTSASRSMQPIPDKIYKLSKCFPDVMTHLSLEIGPFYPIIARDAAKIVPSTRTYCMLADWLVSQNQFDEACEIYQKASEMIPLKLAPKLGILQCLLSESETELALEAAEQILSVPVKIRSRRSIEIMTYARNVADSLKCEICR